MATLLRWCACLTPSLALSGWLALWLQWRFPTEGGLEGLFMLPTALVAGIALGCAPRTRPARAAFATICSLGTAVSAGLTLGLAGTFGSLAITAGVSVILIGLFGVGLLTARWVTTPAPESWRWALATSLVPLIVVLALLGSTPGLKWCWPWSSYGQRMRLAQAAARSAALRLGIPTDRPISPRDLERLRNAVPLHVTFVFPIIGGDVSASVVGPSNNKWFIEDEIWLWWGQGTFGTLSLRYYARHARKRLRRGPASSQPAFRRLDSANDRTRRVGIAPKRTDGHLRERPSPARAPWQ